ncbi:hypothetical protein [Microbacterium sp. gxy059]|uniref:hypothetical protein n=1 Tax=Microbacterium sp. gxy059 TaxID=2957199 RepID=UPI003D95260E
MARRLLASSALLASLVLVSCAAEEPEPTWTEERAYAEAEEVYRAFHEASMERYAGGDDESYLQYLTPEMQDGERDGQEWLDENGLVMGGRTEILAFEPISYSETGESIAVSAEVCIDGSGLFVEDAQGEVVTPREDSPRYQVVVDFTSINSELLISELSEEEGRSC